MSSIASDDSQRTTDTSDSSWLHALLGAGQPVEGGTIEIHGEPFVLKNGILRHGSANTDSQAQTAEVFGYKWQKRHSFESDTWIGNMRDWLVSRYGNPSGWTWLEDYDNPVLLDAGCGAGVSALALFESLLQRLRYLGTDISTAVDVARCRFEEANVPASFIQCDLNRLPLPEKSIDLILSEGVLHHTDSTEAALHKLAAFLKPGGRLLFYVYNTKGPIREFTDDYIRGRLQSMNNEEAWAVLKPLSKLGRALGQLEIELTVPEDIELLDIPAGPIDLQRLFYWHVFKAFYHPDMTLEEMNHINFDWYAPANAHRQTPQQVRTWCANAGLTIEHEHVEQAGITVIARRRP